jgi:hypothetical protein
MDQPTRNATQRNGCLSFCCVLLRVCWSVCLSLSLSPYNKILLRDHHRDKPKAHPLAGQRARRLLCLCLFVCRAFVCVCVVFVFCVSPSNSAPYPPKQVELFLVVCVCVCQGSAFFVLVGFLAAHSIQLATQAGFFVCLFVCLCECVCAFCVLHTPHTWWLFVCLFVCLLCLSLIHRVTSLLTQRTAFQFVRKRGHQSDFWGFVVCVFLFPNPRGGQRGALLVCVSVTGVSLFPVSASYTSHDVGEFDRCCVCVCVCGCVCCCLCVVF